MTYKNYHTPCFPSSLGQDPGADPGTAISFFGNSQQGMNLKTAVAMGALPRLLF